MIKGLLKLHILLSPLFLIAQNNEIDTVKHFLEIQGMYQRGSVFPTNDFVRGINTEQEPISTFQAFSLKLAKQTTGRLPWEQKYLFPKWGLGVYLADFFEAEAIGLPLAIYGFFQAPFHRWKKLSLNYEIGFGATFNWKPFNPVNNQYNIALGSGRSFLIDLGMNLSYPISPYLELGTGFSLTHFSNGGLKQPNYGINTIAPKLSLSYKIKPTSDFNQNTVAEHSPSNEWVIGAFAGSKNVIFKDADIEIKERYEGVFFPVMGVTATFNRHFSYKSKVGAGMGGAYDGSTDAQVAVDEGELEPVSSPFASKLQLNAFLSYELVIHKVAIVIQPSIYLFRKKTVDQSPAFHQRFGVKYHFMPNVFAGIKLRSYSFHISDFVEWNIGYRFGQ